jgi:uncharacterized OB-fold protein
MSATADLNRQLIAFAKQQYLLKRADAVLSASKESIDADEVARNAAACSKLVEDLLSLEPKLNLAWSRWRDEILSAGVSQTPKSPDELEEEFARLWEQQLPLLRDILNLSESEMEKIAKPPDQLIQKIRDPIPPTELPQEFLDNKWTQMMHKRLEQLKGLAEAGARAAAPSVRLNTCPRCGSTITVGQKFCATCGNAVVTQPQPLPPRPQRVPSAPRPIARTCGRCGATVSPGKRFCRSCGANLQETAPSPYVAPTQQPPSVPAPPPRTVTPQGQFCRNCGTQLKPGLRFCTKCGTAVS